VEEILLFDNFFPIIDACLSGEDIARQSCTVVCRRKTFGEFLPPARPVSCVQRILDLHSKFALRLRPHHV